MQRSLARGPELLVRLPQSLRADNADLTLCSRRQIGHFLLRVHIHARNENAIHALESIERLATLRSAPNRIARRFVLPFGKNERHVKRDTCSAQFFERTNSARSCRHFDHAVLMAGAPTLA